MQQMKQTVVPGEAKWIAPAGNPYPVSVTQTAYYRAVIQLEEVDTEKRLHISANSRYCLLVNGIPILDGPCKGDSWRQYCDATDIRQYCHVGNNLLEIKVVAFPPMEALEHHWLSEMGPESIVGNGAGPLLILWCEWTDDYTTGVFPWLCKRDDAISWIQDMGAPHMGCTEEVFGKRLPMSFNRIAEQTEDLMAASSEDGFLKAAPRWRNRISFGELPSLLLYERPINLLIREKIELPEKAVNETQVTIPPDSKHEILIDMGRLTTGYVTFNFKNGKDAKVTILYSEGFGKRGEDGIFYKSDRCDSNGELKGVTDIYHCAGYPNESYKPFWFRTFRFIRLVVETGAEALTLSPPEMTETRYPLEDKVRFKSQKSDAWLNPLWDISLRTLQLCMHETYEDCPFYEQMQYIMDTRLQILFTYAISNDPSMPLRTLYDYHASLLPEGMIQARFPTNYPQIIPIFSLHWILMLKDYVWETDDLEPVRPLRFTVEIILDWFKRKTGSSGLVEGLGYWDFTDWTEEWADRDGSPRAVSQGPSTINNLTYAYVLQEAAILMDMFGMTQAAANYRTEAEGIKNIVNRLCWSNDKQMYQEGPAYEEYSQHAQIFAVLSGAIEGRGAARLMDRLLTDSSLVQCSFVMQYYLFRALEAADAYELTESRWPLWKELPEMNLSTIPEIPGSTARSDCHAWGALLLHELPRKFIGVSAIAPAYKRIRIQPKGLFIGDISGEVPTPHGAVHVDWHFDSDTGCFKIKGSTPVDAEICLPDGTKHNISAGGFNLQCSL